MKISIVLCTYNGARFLSEQLESLTNQTRLPDQIVIQDDVSGDDSWRMLQSFAARAAEKDISVDLVRNPVNLGYAKNFETALRRASGDLVFLCDQDDIWHSDKLDLFHSEFERRAELGLLHSDAILIDAHGDDMGHGLFECMELSAHELEQIHSGNAFDALLRRNVVTGATLACRRDVIEAALPIAPGWIHDEWLAMAGALVSRVDCIERPCISYRQHGQNQIGIRRLTWRDKFGGTGLSRREFVRGMAIKMESLLERVRAGGFSLSEKRLVCLQERIRHGWRRADMPAALSARLPIIIEELKLDGYRKYSSGMRSVVSDILGLQ